MDVGEIGRQRFLHRKTKYTERMTEASIYERLTPLFQEVMETELIPAAPLRSSDVPGWDSLSQIRLVVAVEEEFDIAFTTAEIADLPDLGSFVALIAQKAQ
ncbi:MAG: acyl carrier protein [Rickettsiales bacterium]|nr:acyl carrier protein [Rickettsiales bacterium]